MAQQAQGGKEREAEQREGDIGRRSAEVGGRERKLESKVTELGRRERELEETVSASSYTCHVSGPGLSATANYPTHVIVELSDASGQPCSLRLNVAVELQSLDQSSVVPTSLSVAEVLVEDMSEPLTTTRRWPWSKKKYRTPNPAPARSVCQYKVSYTAVSRGQHKLHVRLNCSETCGSPCNITVYPDPTQLGTPVRVVTGLTRPWGVAINGRGEMVVSNWEGHMVSLLHSRGRTIQTYGSDGYRPDQMRYPRGVAVDGDDNVYVASDHKLQKFSRDGYLIKCVGRCGSKDKEFSYPREVRVHHDYVYVCDLLNNRIQVLDTDLKFIRTISSPGSERGQFNEPYSLDFDNEGKADMYISDRQNHCIQVIDTSGQFVRQFGQEEGEGKLKDPTAVHVMGELVYVSDLGHGRIAVYQTSGQYITSFGRHTNIELGIPYSITSDCNGLIYIPDLYKNVRVF